MADHARADYLMAEICRLEGAIANLEAAGLENFNNARPSVIKNEEKQKRRQAEGYSSEIYQKSGEEVLAELRQVLTQRKSELQNLSRPT